MNRKFKYIKKNHEKYTNKKGVALLIALIAGVALGLLSVTAIIMSSTDTFVGRNVRNLTISSYVAEAGAYKALDIINSSPDYYASIGSGTVIKIIDSETLGNGKCDVIVKRVASDIIGKAVLELTSTGYSSDSNKSVVITVYPEYDSMYKYAAFGKSKITFSGNFPSIDSYNSASAYGGTNVGLLGDIGVNSTAANSLDIGNGDIFGSLVIGPGGDTSTAITTSQNSTLSGTKSTLKQQEPRPPVSIPSFSGTDYSISSSTMTFSPGNYGELKISGSGNITLDAGSNNPGKFYFKSISITSNNGLSISGNVEIYILENLNASGGGIVNSSANTSNLKVYVQKYDPDGDGASNNNITISGNGGFYGTVYAPDVPIKVTGNGDAYGALVGSSVDFAGQGKFHYDTKLSTGDGTVVKYTVKSWKEI